MNRTQVINSGKVETLLKQTCISESNIAHLIEEQLYLCTAAERYQSHW